MKAPTGPLKKAKKKERLIELIEDLNDCLKSKKDNETFVKNHRTVEYKYIDGIELMTTKYNNQPPTQKQTKTSFFDYITNTYKKLFR